MGARSFWVRTLRQTSVPERVREGNGAGDEDEAGGA